MNENLPEPPPWFNRPGPVCIADLTSGELWVYIAGRRDSYAEGVAEGRRQILAEQEEALRLAANASVQASMHDLNYPEHAARRKAVEKRRAENSDTWWAERRQPRPTEEAA